MSLLPTAHAGQSYGSRRIDFFTVSGQVSASNANTGRVTDPDGLEHDVKLIEQSTAFAPGDSATIVRVQSGPNRRSRPVAIVNHSRGVWMRAAPDATSILARSGVTRSFNWWLSILAMVLTATVAVWPTLHVFLTEVNAGMMAGIPAFSVYDELLTRAPGLADWRMETALPAGITDAIAGLGLIAMDQLTALSVFSLSALIAILAFASRSWRLLYVPAFAAFSLIAGAMFGGAETSLIILAGGLALYLAGGLVNRIRDSGRLNARVERLAEHVMRHPPQEEVRSADMPSTAAVASAAAATALAVDDTPAVAEPDAADLETAEAEIAEPVEPAAEDATASAASEAVEPEIAEPEIAELETVEAEAVEAEAVETAATTPEGETASSDPVEEAPEPVQANAAEPTETIAAQSEEQGSEETETLSEPEVSDVAALETATEPTVPVAEASAPEAAETSEDDLPSLEAVAQAAALNASELAETSEDKEIEIDLEDESTMPVPPPPPMPSALEAQADPSTEEAEPASAETPATDDAPETSINDSVNTQLEQVEGTTSPVDAQLRDILEAADAIEAPEASEANEAMPMAADDTADIPAPVDDPVMDDGSDPMTDTAVDGDFAPGAPEIEVEPRPAE